MPEQADERTVQPCERRFDDEGVNLLDCWEVLHRRRAVIFWTVMISVALTILATLFMTNVYRANAVIVPVTAKDGGTGGNAALTALASQFGGLTGISTPSSASTAEIISLLKSNILRERMIRQYDLLPLIFPERWDAGAGTWKRGGAGLSLHSLSEFSLRKRRGAAVSSVSGVKKDPDVPDTWDALRRLDDMIAIRKDVKDQTITISADSPDPAVAARLVECLLVTLTNYMSSEAKRVAATNRRYLEEQLGSTADPIIRQKTYNMIAQQIETAMMAEVKENFAFKVIDPPLTPDRTVRPKRILMVAVSLAAALLIGTLLAFFLEYLKKEQARGREVGV